jgi:hypothetical protein
MKQGIYFPLNINSMSFQIIRKLNICFILIFFIQREWDRFAKTEYERLAMEEE